LLNLPTIAHNMDSKAKL